METKDALTVADVLAKNLIQFCEQNGVVCEVTLTATLPLRMGGAKMTHSVREARKLDTPIERPVQSIAEKRCGPYEDGRRAANKGWRRDANPFGEDCPNSRELWFKGYDEVNSVHHHFSYQKGRQDCANGIKRNDPPYIGKTTLELWYQGWDSMYTEMNGRNVKSLTKLIGEAIRNSQTQEAFQEGKEAYHKGVPAGNNPYVGCVQCLYDSWSAGWHGEHKRALFPGLYTKDGENKA